MTDDRRQAREDRTVQLRKKPRLYRASEFDRFSERWPSNLARLIFFLGAIVSVPGVAYFALRAELSPAYYFVGWAMLLLTSMIGIAITYTPKKYEQLAQIADDLDNVNQHLVSQSQLLEQIARNTGQIQFLAERIASTIPPDEPRLTRVDVISTPATRSKQAPKM